MTNEQFANQDPTFRKACEIAKIFNPKTEKMESLKPTKRQASKWRNKKGLAHRFRGSAASTLTREAKP